MNAKTNRDAGSIARELPKKTLRHAAGRVRAELPKTGRLRKILRLVGALVRLLLAAVFLIVAAIFLHGGAALLLAVCQGNIDALGPLPGPVWFGLVLCCGLGVISGRCGLEILRRPA